MNQMFISKTTFSDALPVLTLVAAALKLVIARVRRLGARGHKIIIHNGSIRLGPISAAGTLMQWMIKYEIQGAVHKAKIPIHAASADIFAALGFAAKQTSH